MNIKVSIKPVEMTIEEENILKFEGAIVEITDLSMKEYIELTALSFRQQDKIMAQLPNMIHTVGESLLDLYKQKTEFDMDVAAKIEEFINEDHQHHAFQMNEDQSAEDIANHMMSKALREALSSMAVAKNAFQPKDQ